MTTLPWGRALTYDDLESMPDDGHRYELIDGVLIVSPSPRVRRQEVAGALYVALLAARPDRSIGFSWRRSMSSRPSRRF